MHPTDLIQEFCKTGALFVHVTAKATPQVKTHHSLRPQRALDHIGNGDSADERRLQHGKVVHLVQDCPVVSHDHNLRMISLLRRIQCERECPATRSHAEQQFSNLVHNILD